MLTVTATQKSVPPTWALLQRHLIEIMNEAGHLFLDKYTREDGTIVWRDHWPGMDGSDDAYESFHTFPLFYALGGAEDYRHLGRKQWEAVTWQFTEYGQLHREFDAYYDWMHHGESYLYFYFLALADPYTLRDYQRSVRFANFYTGDDPEADNYDSDLRLIKSPINGSRGAQLQMTAEDWSTHRWVLGHHIFPLPYEDIPGVPGPVADWEDDAVFEKILTVLNQRMARGDVPINLFATTLVTHAYLYTGQEKYKNWVLDYFDAWQERTLANNGIVPDNIGLSGQIGEYMDGKWWGGYYGWRWPHGGTVLLEALTVAGQNAMLLTGDDRMLDLARSQLDHLWELRQKIDGEWQIPHRYNDSGWNNFRPMSPELPVQLWCMSGSASDAERILRIGNPDRLTHVFSARGGEGNAGWFRFVNGNAPDYPEHILQTSYNAVSQALDEIRDDDVAPDKLYIQHWISRNPVICNALLQLTTGTPNPIYHGGLVQSRLRYFDVDQKRPGLPPNVAALIDQIEFENHPQESFRLQLVNLSPIHNQSLYLQAGTFGQHNLRCVKTEGKTHTMEGKWLRASLPPATSIEMRLTIDRFVNQPSYDTPIKSRTEGQSIIKVRNPDVDPGSISFRWEPDHPIKEEKK